MRRVLWGVMSALAFFACARPVGAPRGPAGQALGPSGPPPPPSVASGPLPPPPEKDAPPPNAERFEPAQRFVRDTKLALYSYHEKYIGNAEGYLAPILRVADGGFVVVGTRADYPEGQYQVGKSRPVVAKLDGAGKKSWERSYRTSGFLDYEGASAIELPDGYVVYVLSYVHPSRGAVVRLLRLDRQGEIVWDRRFRGQGGVNTPFAQYVQLVGDKLLLDGHMYKDKTETAYGWKGILSLEGKIEKDEVGEANPYSKD